MEQISGWSDLPADNLQSIFKNLELFDVEKCLLVCKNWFDEANFYLKDKVYFYTSNVGEIEDVIESRRRFQKVHVTGLDIESMNLTDVSVLEALMKKRDLKVNDEILEASIQYNKYTTLSKILQLLGKHVKSLNLVNFVNEAPVTVNEREHIFNGGLQRQYATLDYGCLSSVEELKVFIIDNGLLNISQNFGNLRSLTLNSRFTMTQDFLSTSLLQDFIGLNPFLKKLHLLEGFLGLETEGRTFSVKTLLSFENVKNLESLHLMTISHDQDVEDLGNNFNNLEVLEISELSDTHFNPRCVRKIFQLPNLRSISILNSYLGKEFWEESFTNLKNPKITHLTLNGFDIEEASLIACFRCLPNMESFTCEGITSFSLLMFKEMAKNWKNLKSLILTFEENSFQESNINEPCSFENLINLTLSQRFNDVSMLPFFTNFKAGNLKNLAIDILFCNEQSKEELQRNFSLISQNCPKVEFLKFTGEEKDMVSVVLPNFSILKTLYIFGWYEDLYSNNNSIVKVLESVLSIKKDPLKIIFDLEYVPVLDEFCQAKGVTAEFKNSDLKRILIGNKEFLFNIN